MKKVVQPKPSRRRRQSDVEGADRLVELSRRRRRSGQEQADDEPELEPNANPTPGPSPVSNCACREEISRKQAPKTPYCSILAVKRYICYRCLKRPISSGTENPLQRCIKCRRVVYCSTACQSLDWHLWHKRECKALQAHNARERGVTARYRSWEEYFDYIVSCWIPA